MDQEGPIRWQTRTLHSLHLAILRFALTLDNADRLGVLAIASEIDRPHRPHDEQMDFDFFRRSSTELCEAILHPNKNGAETKLQQYLARIDDAQLMRALATVIKVEQPEYTKPRSKAYSAIWRGLPSRHDA